MFGSNGPCPTSPAEYFMPCSILDPVFYSCDQQYQHMQMDSSGTDCHSSPPETPDFGLINVPGSLPSPSDISSCSYGETTSPEDNHPSVSPPSFLSNPGDIPSIQKTRSKLIKEGLKLTIQSKRIVNGMSNIQYDYPMTSQDELTPEDEERRKRRRERNKVAATKCRNKKKERTGRLAVESDSLEVDNSALRREIHSLEQERKNLADLLQHHMPFCERSTTRSSCAHVHNTVSWSSAVAS